MSEYTICSHCNEKPAAICISCLTDCTELKQQPTAGAFTTMARKTADNIYANDPRFWPSKSCLSSYIKEACDRLDNSEAEKKDLLKALIKAKSMINHVGHPKPVCVDGGFPTEDGADQCQWCDEYSQIEAAIAKVQKG